jgi:hypothetical protein
MKTKIIFALLTVAALGVLATGIVLAHNTPMPTTLYNDQYAPEQDYYGWGGCYRYGYNQPYCQYPPVQQPDTAQQPQTPVTPQQPEQPSQGYYYPPQYHDEGYYPRGYGHGCWGW